MLTQSVDCVVGGASLCFCSSGLASNVYIPTPLLGVWYVLYIDYEKGQPGGGILIELNFKQGNYGL
jgi:hypothetical protein